jgi:hypothetical protein
MEYAYEHLEDLAEELGVEREDLQDTARRLGIKTLQTAVPPYGVDVSLAVTHGDAMQLRERYGFTVH